MSGREDSYFLVNKVFHPRCDAELVPGTQTDLRIDEVIGLLLQEVVRFPKKPVIIGVIGRQVARPDRSSWYIADPRQR